MQKLYWLGLVVLTLAALGAAQDKVFDWVHAYDEAAQLDPMDFHAGHVYHPAPGGGKMHLAIQATLPVTLALAFNDEWTAAQGHPDAIRSLQLLCVQEHVTTATYECQMPNARQMVLLVRDERVPERAVVQDVVAVFGHGARKFISPNDIKINYFNWDCVQNCIQPAFQWSVLVKEKYELSEVPKVYSLLSPERDGQPVWIRIKAPIPMTVALMSSTLADKIYDDPSTLASALESTSCKQRGVQSLSFSCNVNLGDGRQSLVLLPESRGNVPHKKAEIEMQSQQCTANCDLIKKQQ